MTLATNEKRDAELERIQALDTWAIAPLGGAILVDALLQMGSSSRAGHFPYILPVKYGWYR